jgi:hypothetical protein
VETSEGEEGLVYGCSRTDANNDVVMVAMEATVASYHDCSLTPNHRVQDASSARDLLRLAMIAVIAVSLASIVVSTSPIASTHQIESGKNWGYLGIYSRIIFLWRMT